MSYKHWFLKGGLILISLVNLNTLVFAEQVISGEGQLSDPVLSDLSFQTNIHADSVLFETKPVVRTKFTGEPSNISGWGTIKDNLPRDIKPGVTYKNVNVRYGLTTRIPLDSERNTNLNEIQNPIPETKQ